MKRAYCFSGGGTMGSVSPLLAIAEYVRDREGAGASIFFIGTLDGPEREVIQEEGFDFFPIRSGKLRRYLDIRNLLDPWNIVLGFVDAIRILRSRKPSVMISAGAYVSVPVAFACRILRIPIVIHQQDLRPGLANKIMAPMADKVTVSFEESCHQFSLKKTVWCGNPVRKSIYRGSAERARDLFSLESGVPVVAVFGGGTGALALNKLVVEALPSLLEFCQVVHSAGKGKNVFQEQLFGDLQTPESVIEQTSDNPYQRYHVLEFISADEVKDVYAAADLVVTRAGLSTLSELSVLGKPSITIPIPHSHQEDNAGFYERHRATVILSERTLTPQILTTTISGILHHATMRSALSQHIKLLNRPDAAKAVYEEIQKVL